MTGERLGIRARRERNPSPPSRRASGSRRRARRRGLIGDLLWLVAPVLAVGGVIAYFGASVALGVNPPFSVVDGQSMRPTFSPGDLVIVKGVPAQDLEVGDIVSISTPEEAKKEKHLPDEIVHRIVKQRGAASDVSYITKGDNNPGEDAFVTRPSDVRGVVVKSIPGLGYPVLFFRSQQGRIFGAALGIVIVGYFVIAAVERRQEAAELESPTRAVEQLGAEFQQLREAVTSSVPPGLDPEEVTQLLREHQEDRETLYVLVGAVQEYGEHLRSHTRAVQSMAAAAEDLARVTEQIRSVLATAEEPPPRSS
ncbi:signal peptidase I [Nocardioides pyridinolyticus]